MTVQKLILALTSSLLIYFAQAQEQYTDTIFFMNGHVLQCEINDDSQIDVVFTYPKKKRVKTKNVHKSEIFGLIKDGEKTIYYLQNDIAGDNLTISEVEIFLAGQRDARDNYKTKHIFYSGLGLNILTSSLGEASLLAVSTPMLVFTSIQYIPFIKIKEETISNKLHKHNMIYAEGYEGVARGKRAMAALKGSALGTGLGAALFHLALK